MPYNRLFDTTNRYQTDQIRGNPDLDAQNLFLAADKPYLDFNFVNNTYRVGTTELDDIKTVSGVGFSRNSVALGDRSDGTWVSFPVNTPRITDKGLIIEMASTNLITNNSMTGAVAGNPGTLPTNWIAFYNAGGTGLTRSVVGTGTEYGLPYIDIRFQGTTTSATEGYYIYFSGGVSAISASSGQTYTGSIFTRVVSGLALPTLTNGLSTYNIVLYENGSGAPAGVYGTSVSTTFNRISQATTLSGTGTTTIALGMYIRVQQNLSHDFILRIYAPQLERIGSTGAFYSPTSPILTTNAAVTRPRDSFVFTFGSAYTGPFAMAGEYESFTKSSAGNYVFIGSTRFTGNSRWIMTYTEQSNFRTTIYDSGFVGNTVIATGLADNKVQNWAVKYDDVISSSVNGSTPVSNPTTVNHPTGALADMTFGDFVGDIRNRIYIRKFSLFQRAISSSQLQLLSQNKVVD